MINNVRVPGATWTVLPLIAMLVMLLVAGAGTATAQAPQGTVSIHTYACPADYDQVSDCTRIGGVSIRVSTDAPSSSDVVTIAEAPVEVTVVPGTTVTSTGASQARRPGP